MLSIALAPGSITSIILSSRKGASVAKRGGGGQCRRCGWRAGSGQICRNTLFPSAKDMRTRKPHRSWFRNGPHWRDAGTWGDGTRGFCANGPVSDAGTGDDDGVWSSVCSSPASRTAKTTPTCWFQPGRVCTHEHFAPPAPAWTADRCGEGGGARSTALGEVLRTEGFWARRKGDIFRNLRYCEVPCDAFASVADKRKISATLQGAELETVRSTPCFRAAHAFLTCIPRVRAQEHETTRLDNTI